MTNYNYSVDKHRFFYDKALQILAKHADEKGKIGKGRSRQLLALGLSLKRAEFRRVLGWLVEDGMVERLGYQTLRVVDPQKLVGNGQKSLSASQSARAPEAPQGGTR